MSQKNSSKTEYTKIKAYKKQMSQMFDENSKVVPFTYVKLDNLKDIDFIPESDELLKIKVIGRAKGKGFAGTVKRWGFRAGPNTHGQIKRRSPGSIGAQGVGRVWPGKKMAGRMGGQKITVDSKVLGIEKDEGLVRLSGCVPGSRNSAVYLYVNNISKDEN